MKAKNLKLIARTEEDLKSSISTSTRLNSKYF